MDDTQEDEVQSSAMATPIKRKNKKNKKGQATASPSSVVKAMRLEQRQKFDEERDRILEKVPAAYKEQFGQIAFSKWAKHALPVLILNPYRVPPHPVRDDWLTAFQKLEAQGRLAALPYLVYWYGTENLGQGYSFLPKKQVTLYQTAKSKKMHILPPAIQRKLDKGTVELSEADQNALRGYQEMSEDLALEPHERRRGVMEWKEDYDMLSDTDMADDDDDKPDGSPEKPKARSKKKRKAAEEPIGEQEEAPGPPKKKKKKKKKTNDTEEQPPVEEMVGDAEDEGEATITKKKKKKKKVREVTAPEADIIVVDDEEEGGPITMDAPIKRKKKKRKVPPTEEPPQEDELEDTKPVSKKHKKKEKQSPPPEEEPTTKGEHQEQETEVAPGTTVHNEEEMVIPKKKKAKAPKLRLRISKAAQEAAASSPKPPSSPSSPTPLSPALATTHEMEIAETVDEEPRKTTPPPTPPQEQEDEAPKKTEDEPKSEKDDPVEEYKKAMALEDALQDTDEEEEFKDDEDFCEEEGKRLKKKKKKGKKGRKSISRSDNDDDGDDDEELVDVVDDEDDELLANGSKSRLNKANKRKSSEAKPAKKPPTNDALRKREQRAFRKSEKNLCGLLEKWQSLVEEKLVKDLQTIILEIIPRVEEFSVKFLEVYPVTQLLKETKAVLKSHDESIEKCAELKEAFKVSYVTRRKDLPEKVNVRKDETLSINQPKKKQRPETPTNVPEIDSSSSTRKSPPPPSRETSTTKLEEAKPSVVKKEEPKAGPIKKEEPKVVPPRKEDPPKKKGFSLNKFKRTGSTESAVSKTDSKSRKSLGGGNSNSTTPGSLPRWMTEAPSSPKIALEEDPLRGLGLEFLLEMAVQYLATCKTAVTIHPEYSARHLEQAVHEFAQKSSPLDQLKQSNYWKKIHALVAGICGRMEPGTLLQSIAAGKYTTAQQLVELSYDQLGKAFDGGRV